MGRALVLFSGGQDSTVCLAWAMKRFEHVETVGFDYGQRHRSELAQRAKLRASLPSFITDAGTLGEDHMLNLPALGEISETALTRDSEITFAKSGLPTTFVPGRNILFLTYAAALGYRRNLSTLVGGMCETDYSGYPDCRNETLQTLAKALGLGLEQPVTIETPLMYMDKAATWQMAFDLGGQDLIDLVVAESHTCYLDDRTTKHEWGYGCGTCPACRLRAQGWQKWQETRTTTTAANS